ncbi:zinc knuckle CX2CX4HX4C containing protein [Tanacetum coccineum]
MHKATAMVSNQLPEPSFLKVARQGVRMVRHPLYLGSGYKAESTNPLLRQIEVMQTGLDVYIHHYLLKWKLHASAKAFMAEGKVVTDHVVLNDMEPICVLHHVFVLREGVREMEQGFLNRSSKSKNKKKDLSDSIQKKASLLTDLAKKVKNIEGKMLGKDGKPMKAVRYVKSVEAPVVAESMDANRADVGVTVHEAAPSNLDEGSFDKNGPNADTPASYVGINSHDVTSENKEDEGAVKITSPGPLNSRSIEGTKRDTCSSIKIVKVNTLINEEKVLGAHVALPLATVNEICAKFDNTLYGYFIDSWLAFPIVRNYVRNAWAKYGFESVIVRDGFFLFKFSSQEGLNKVLHGGPWFIKSRPIILNIWSANSKMKKEDCTRIPVWTKIHNVPVVAFSEVGLSLITTQLGRPLMLDARTSDMCLNPWGSNTYARVLIELSAHRAIMDFVIVAVPFPNGNGHSLENLDVEYEWRPLRCSLCNVFGHDDAVCPARDNNAASKLLLGKGCSSSFGSKGTKQPSNSKPIHGIRFSKPKAKFVYRPVSKASQGETTSPPTKEGNNIAVDKPCEPNVAAVNDIPREIGKSTFIQDNINLGDLRKNMDRIMEEDMVLDINTDYCGNKTLKENSECSSSSQLEGNSHETRSVWERFKEVKKTSTIDSESDEDEVYSPDYHKSNYVASASGEFTLEDDDLDCYDGYEAPLYDIPDEMQKFCDNYDIRLKSRVSVDALERRLQSPENQAKKAFAMSKGYKMEECSSFLFDESHLGRMKVPHMLKYIGDATEPIREVITSAMAEKATTTTKWAAMRSSIALGHIFCLRTKTELDPVFGMSHENLFWNCELKEKENEKPAILMAESVSDASEKDNAPLSLNDSVKRKLHMGGSSSDFFADKRRNLNLYTAEYELIPESLYLTIEYNAHCIESSARKAQVWVEVEKSLNIRLQWYNNIALARALTGAKVQSRQ